MNMFFFKGLGQFAPFKCICIINIYIYTSTVPLLKILLRNINLYSFVLVFSSAIRFLENFIFQFYFRLRACYVFLFLLKKIILSDVIHSL